MINVGIRSGLAFWIALATFSCSGDPAPPATTTGGTTGTQGGTTSPTSGGTTNGGTTNGGTTPTSGGAMVANGGMPAATSGGATSGGTTSGGASTGGASGVGGTSSGGSMSGGVGGSGTGGAASTAGKFSFFVTSIAAMRELSNSQDGFGGDLRFGEATGLAGADKICRTIAEKSMPGAGQKTWRAFLSTIGFEGQPQVNAIDRIGNGPWYDRLGRLVASGKTTLVNVRPSDADAAIKLDLPNENGIPNHTDGAPGCVASNTCPDNHDVLTGTGPMGTLYSKNNYNTCNDWTSSAGQPGLPGGGGGGAGGTGGGTGGSTTTGGRNGGGGFPMAKGPWCGHSWPRTQSGENWMSALAEGGCAPGVYLVDKGGPMTGVYTVGTGGGYGAIYCFALEP